MEKERKKTVKKKIEEKPKVKRKRRKKKKKGFTLIELLAVIVILGLLMAIAIPSVTRYITESRKKTVTTTLNNYIGALVNEVNDLSYTFTGQNTIYAVPIECISLERGGTNPFGEWYQANDNYFAYVLIQYNDVNSKYIYGFTFKDSAGYGLYPITQSKINERGKQIKTGLDLNKPETGDITSLTTLANWENSGFEVDSTTEFKVLEATSEGEIGDGKETCTLCQKGKNYARVEEEKELNKPEEKLAMLRSVNGSSDKYAFWNYRNKIKTITFENSINIPSDVLESWDVSSTGNGKVMAYIIPNVANSSYYDLYIQSNEKLYANSNSSYLFAYFTYLEGINNLELLNTSRVLDMNHMFMNTGYYSSSLKLNLGDNFDTSNVTDMSYMFYKTGWNSAGFTLELGSSFDTSNVNNMSYMFRETGYKSTYFVLNLGEKFNTSKVTNMSNMFCYTGYTNPNFTLDLGDSFDTSSVVNMEWMFQCVGRKSTLFTLDLGKKFDTSNVTSMVGMFISTGSSNPNFTLDLGEKFDTSSVTTMEGMFSGIARNSKIFVLDLGEKFDTSNVTRMDEMFDNAGYYSTAFTLNLGEKFDTSKVTRMDNMFNGMGRSSTVLTLDLGENFDTSKVTSMESMFSYVGYSSPNFILDLGEKFNTSNVTNMGSMFAYAGHANSNFILDLGDKFYINKVTDMGLMFRNNVFSEVRLNASSFKSGVKLGNMFYNAVPTTVYVKTENDKKLLDAKKFSNVTTIVG